MQWYWYVLIGLGVVGLGALKLYAWKRIKDNRSGKGGKSDHPDED